MVKLLQNVPELEAEIQRVGSAGVIFVDFYADWCPPCRAIAPFYEQLSGRYGNISFCKVNVDHSRDIAGRYGVRAMPTFVVLKGGQEVERIQGANQGRLSALADQYSKTANPNAATLDERKFLERFTQQSERFVMYYDNELQQTIPRSVIPQEISDLVEKDGPTLEAAVKLLEWFKSDFFRWLDSPDCQQCGKQTPSGKGLSGTPTREETESGAGRVEVYTCPDCHVEVRFPRYNDPMKLIETRCGRCGEWANCFVLLTTALGFKTRFIYDTTDHVWAELFVSNRWVHFDPCEATFDKPLLYEIGWGKSLSYVVAFGRDHVADVTWKYVKDPKETMKKRNMVREPLLSSFLSKLSARVLQRVAPSTEWQAQREKELRQERVTELLESIRLGPIDEKSYGGRLSGDAAWRRQRGEDGQSTSTGYAPCNAAPVVAKFEPYTIRVSKEQANENGEFVVEYDAVRDVYSIGGEERVGWKSAVHSVSNLQRKVEHDWKMVYLCREEGATEASIEWEVDLAGVEVSSISLEARDWLQQDGSRIVLTACSGDACMMAFPSRTLELSSDDLPSTRPLPPLHIKAMFMGGSSPATFQHAQLFRASLTTPNPPHLRLVIKLK